MIDKIFDSIMSVQGPDRIRKIVALCLTVVIATVLLDVATGIITHTVYRYRIQTIQTLREEAEHAAALQSKVANRALEETDILLNKITQRLSLAEIEMRTPTIRLWSLVRPFAGGAAFWFIVGIVVGFGSAELPEVKAKLKKDADPTGRMVAQIAAWFGVVCGLFGLVFNHDPSWWITFVLFPIVAGFGVISLCFVLGLLIGTKTEMSDNLENGLKTTASQTPQK